MLCFAPAPFRYPPINGIDYPYGWQDLPQSLFDTLLAAGKVYPNEPRDELNQVRWNPTRTGFPDPVTGNTISLNVAGPRVAWIGDSIMANGYSGLQRTNGSLQAWTAALTGQRFSTPASLMFATTGYTSTDIINNWLQPAAAAAANWDIAVVLIGTNDIGGLFTNATIKANLTQIYSTLTALNKQVIAVPITPRAYWSPSGFIPATALKQIEYINHWIRLYVKNNKNMWLADPWQNMYDPATGYCLGGGIAGSPPPATGYTYDGLHPAARGGYWVSAAIAGVLNQMLPAADSSSWSLNDVYDATYNPTGNLLANGQLTTTTGGTAGLGVTGTVGGSFSIARIVGTTGACAASIVTKTLPNGQTYNAQRMAITAPGGSAEERFRMQQQQFVAGLIGKTVVAEADFAVSGVTADSFLYAYLEATDGVSDARELYLTTGYLMPNVSWSGTLRTAPFVLAASVQELDIQVGINGTVASAGVTVDASRITFRPVE